MIKKTINRILAAIVDFLDPQPLEPLPPIQVPALPPPPDPKTAAAEMRATAAKLINLADRLDPTNACENYTRLIDAHIPELPLGWNTVMPEKGKLSKVKRSEPKRPSCADGLTKSLDQCWGNTEPLAIEDPWSCLEDKKTLGK